MEWFHQIDLVGLRLMNQDGANSLLDWFFPRMAAPSYFILPGLLLALGFLWRGGNRGRLLVGLVVAALLIGDAGIVAGLKKIVNRPRPHEAVEGVRRVTKEGITISHPVEKIERGRSFPSGHVCNNVAWVVIVVALYGRKWRWLYLWPLLMGWNRIYLGSHYPSDVLFSWVISLGYTSLLLWIFRRQIAIMLEINREKEEEILER
jgi:undecaprenyl-diphosphatase